VDWFFSSWDEDVNVPLAEENEPISSINSELLAKAENLSKNLVFVCPNSPFGFL